MLTLGEPNYGLRHEEGILEARGTFVICDEIDLLDTEFYARAMALLERSDTEMVVGSKVMVGSERPAAAVPARRDARLQRHAARDLSASTAPTRTASRRFGATALLETARRCVLDRDVFASEFVIRAHREGKQGASRSPSPCARSGRRRSTSRSASRTSSRASRGSRSPCAAADRPRRPTVR